jgi:DNA topoisomerase III
MKAVAAETMRLAIWLAGSKTLEVAQELYDGQGKKIITYPRAEVRYLPQT